MTKLEITIDVIVHATENLAKFFESFNEMFELEDKEFLVSNVIGHFENPITVLKAKVTKKPAREFLDKFLKILSEEQKSEIKKEIEERTENSTLHIRFDKQEFIQGRISFKEKEAIRLKIHTPIYNKNDTVKVFSEIFEDLT
jgi:RNA binding exosome subunit